MSKHEIAADLTKSAIENHLIKFNNHAYANDGACETQNAFNEKQVADFFTAIYKAVDSAE